MTKKTILVIEDNPLNMKLMRVLLGLADHTVLEAADAEKGIRVTRGKRDPISFDGYSVAGHGRIRGHEDH